MAGSPRRQIIGRNARRPEEAGASVNARRKTGPRDPDAPYFVTEDQARFISMKIIKCNKLSSARHDYPKAPRIFRHFAAFIYYDCRSFAEYTEVTYIQMTSDKQTRSSSWLLRSCKRSRFKIELYFIFGYLLTYCSARNNPPRFLIDGQTEIVLRLKEESETPIGSLIYKLKGIDPDNDILTFGVREQPGSDVIQVENFGFNEANIYLNKLLDRETRDEYALVLTLTDGRLGEGNFITQSLLLLVEDINDNVPIFRPHPTSLTLREDSRPGILTTVEATDADLGAHGQVVYYLQELDGDNSVFSISTVNGKGVIRLVGSLDYERKYLYQLRILAVDRAINEKVNTGTTAILIKVQDVEDQPPEFIAMTPVARISENVRIGTSVLQVRAVDGDKGINNKVTYSITKGPRYLFDIDATSGLVFTRAQLDREAEENSDGTFILEITVKEVSKIVPPPSVSTEVTIILTDVNDETPTFRSMLYRAEINENAPENTPANFIGDAVPEVFDHDLGSNGTFRIFIEGDGGMFDVTPFRGINEAPFLIRVKDSNKLDFEKISVVNFTLVAKEITPISPKYSAVPVTVFIKDQNDNYPEFTEDIYEVSIPENCVEGTTVAWVQALDADSDNLGTHGIRYTTLGGSIAHALTMDPLTGVITVKHPGSSFDRELVARHYLTVEARDNLGKGNRNAAQLIINIDDVNDNAPIFLQNKYEAVLLENEDHFESPLIVEASDNDLNGTRNSEIVYALVSSEFSRNFTIDPKRGIVTPTRPLDYEALPINQGHKEMIIQLRLTVRARDMGTPSLISDVPLMIYLRDVNDNAPVFERTLYKRNIPEDSPGGTNIVQVKAWDKDLSSPNNKLVYRIQSGAGDKFVISPETGVIRVAPGSNLDPDLTSPKTTRYNLNVIAIDSGTEIQQTAEVLVNITILDVNNKPPVFIDPGTVTIRENTQVGAYVHRIVAQDPDVAPILRYRVDPNSSEARNEEGTLIKVQEYDYLAALELNALDGLLRIVKLLDRERVETIRLGFVVEDLAAVRGLQTASATLSIIIEDENDNNPKFRRPFYRRSVTENSKNGVNIVNIVADDADKNRSITYSLQGPKEITDLVHLDHETGEMVVANKIDREMYSWLNLTVKATDSGIPPRSSLSEVYVQVLDENDNNPYFVSNISNVTVMENSKIGTEIAVIQAADSDSGDYGKITYLLDRISTGSLTVADVLDWEIRHSYVLVIEAWDNYQFGYTAGESRNAFKQIQVTVIDVNDNVPKMDIPQDCISISEFHDIRDLIYVIKVKDADDPTTPNGRVVIRITSGNELGLFLLEQTDHWTAKIKAAQSLRGKFGNYTLNVEARDLGTPSNKDKGILKICVTDYNDNPPLFISPQHNTTIRVPENITIGSPIIQIEAKDADTGLNGDVHYRLKQDLAGHWKTFRIDEKTGVISLKLPLDRETQKLYEIRVEAYDLGTPTPLSSDLDLIIYVRNINDFEPQFSVSVFNVNFTEEQPPGSEMVLLPETFDNDDVDELDDPPTQVCYFIVGGNNDGLFVLDIYKHELGTAKLLDREQQEEHVLLIKATEDCKTMPENQTMLDKTDATLLQVIVKVDDINDNAPQFIKDVFTGGVTTEADFGTQFMHVKAIDADAGNNAILSYYQVGKIHMTLTEGFEDMQMQPFLVNKDDGAVSLNFDPQRGMKGYFDFMVLVNDTYGLQDTARVFIYLLREDQRVRFVLRQHPPEVRSRIETFREILGNVTSAIINVDEYKVHENQDGSVDRTKTDLYLHLVNRRDNSILEVSEVLELVDRNIEKLDNLFKEFNVLDTQPAKPEPIIQYEQAGTTFWLLTLTLFLGALLILCVALCLSQRASFRRQLKAANASPFGVSDSEFIRSPGRVPNTNKHSVEGSNPIWMHAYENEWFKNDESFSHTSERDSLDENALNNEEMMNEANTNQRSEDKPYYIEPRISTISRMPFVGAWFKAWVYLGLVCGWSKSARPRFDTSTDMGLVLVPADAEVDSVIFRLRATDQDADFPLVFEITATITPVVRIDNLPCTLYNKVCQANVILTKRLMPGRLHDFAVRVRDTKGDSNSMQATISATNATTSRDKIFPHIPSLIMVPEDAKPGRELDYLLVRANSWSGKPVYIELWQPKELFTIRQRQTPTQTRGVITLIGELDFETQSMYTLTIYATDPYTEPGKDTRNIAGLNIVVIVQDVQDVPPIFTLAPPLTKLNNSVQIGDVILRVHAEDGDKGVPREITYGLVSEGNPFIPFFNISETTGEIVLAKPLEELTQITHVGAPVVLTVVAEEIRRSKDEPPAQATVVDVGFLLGEPGNSPPYFENDNYVTSIPENLDPGSVIMFPEQYSTRVHDEDIGKAGVFALKLQNNNGTFEINPTVAERTANFILMVRDNTLIDYEMHESLSFKIIAQEVGPATNLSASATVVIFIQDVNDNPPVFDEESYEVTLSENVTAGTRVIQVHATDKDTGLFGSIRYTGIIGEGSDAFAIDPDTGLITVAMGSSLDREMAAQLQLIVIARDENGKGNTGEVPLIVNLLDVNDNAPIFEKNAYEFTLNSDLTNFSTPAIIKATDADAEPPNNEIRYELIHGNYENKFYLNEITGELTLLSPVTKFRRKKQKYRRKRAEADILYTLTARAYDLGVPHLASETEIFIVRGTAMEARIMMFVISGDHPNLTTTTETLATITGGRITVLETRPYVSNNKTVTSSPVPAGEKRTIIVARVEQTEIGTPLVDVEKIRNILAANGVGIINGAGTTNESMTDYESTTKLPIDGVIHNGGDGTETYVNKTIIGDDEVTVYKAENKLLLWLLIILGLLMLLAIAALIICCICPGCPFYMAPRKRRIHSSETLIARSDGRPKRHLHRKPPAIDIITSNGRKQAWSADPTRRNWQFNRQNTKNDGLASLPGDVVYISERRPIDQANVESLRLRDGPAYDLSRRRFEEQERIYVQDVERKARELRERDYDAMEADSLQRHEIERGSDIQRQAYRQRYVDPELSNETAIREQHFYREGNAEVLQLITRGQVEDRSQHRHYPTFIVDGKDVLLQRFMQDQKARHELSVQEPEVVRTIDSHQRSRNLYQHKQEILLLPEELDVRRRRAEELESSAQKLAMDDKYATQNIDAESQMRDVRHQEISTNVPGISPKDKSSIVKDQTQSTTMQSYTFHDMELARQNALLTRILLERESRHAGGVMMDAASYLETQSLPGQVAIGTQTDRAAATQTDRHVRSRSDNDESDEDIRNRKRIKKRHGESELRTRTLWMKTPIKEEEGPCFDKRLNILRKKVQAVKEGRKVSLEPEVLREISDSLDENGSTCREKARKSKTRQQYTEESSIGYKVLGEKNGSSSSTEADKQHDKSSDEKRVKSLSSPEINIDNGKYIRETMEKTSTRKESRIKKQKKVESVIKPSFRVLEKEITMLTKKLSKLADKKVQQTTGSESTSQEKSKTSQDSKKDSGSTSKKTEDSKKHKRFEVSPSTSKEKREKFKYQQPQIMSAGSSENEDAFEKTKKSKLTSQEAAKHKQTSSHTKVKRQTLERKERKKQIVQQDRELEKRRKAASKESGRPKTDKVTSRMQKLAAIGRKKHISEEPSTSTSSDHMNGKKDSFMSRDFDKKSTESSEIPSNHADQQKSKQKLHVSEKFSDDFVPEPQRRDIDQPSVFLPIMDRNIDKEDVVNGKEDIEIIQQFSDDFVIEPQTKKLKHQMQAVESEVFSSNKENVYHDFDKEHLTLKETIEDLAIVQNVEDTQHKSETILDIPSKEQSELFEVSKRELEDSSKRIMPSDSLITKALEETEKVPSYSEERAVERRIAYMSGKHKEIAEESSYETEQEMSEKEEVTPEKELHEIQRSKAVEEIVSEKAIALEKHIESLTKSIDGTEHIEEEKEEEHKNGYTSLYSSETDKTEELYKTESDQKEELSLESEKHVEEEISSTKDAIDTGQKMEELMQRENGEDLLREIKNDVERPKEYEIQESDVEKREESTTTASEESFDTSRPFTDDTKNLNGFQRAFAIDDDTLLYIDETSNSDEADDLITKIEIESHEIKKESHISPERLSDSHKTKEEEFDEDKLLTSLTDITTSKKEVIEEQLQVEHTKEKEESLFQEETADEKAAEKVSAGKEGSDEEAFTILSSTSFEVLDKESSIELPKEDSNLQQSTVSEPDMVESFVIISKSTAVAEPQDKGEQQADVSVPIFSSFIDDTLDVSEESDSSSDVSRKTTLTTRPYDTPRHRQKWQQQESIEIAGMSGVRTFRDGEDARTETELEEDTDSNLSLDEIEKTEDSITTESTSELKEDIEIAGTSEKTFSDEKISPISLLKEGNDKDITDKDFESKIEIEEPETDIKSEIKNLLTTIQDIVPLTLSIKELNDIPKENINDEIPVIKEDAESKSEIATPRKKTEKMFESKSKKSERMKVPSPGKRKRVLDKSEEKATPSYSQRRPRKFIDDDSVKQRESSESQKRSPQREEEQHPRKQQVPKSKFKTDKKATIPPKTGEVDISKTQSKYMAWYNKKREEAEKKRLEKKATDDEEQLPRWVSRNLKQTTKQREKLTVERKTPEMTPRTKRKIKPLVNVESEQLKAIVRQGRQLRRAEGNLKEDPTIQIFARPPPVSTSDTQHRLLQHSEYKYERIPPPFYLHPPPVPHPSPQLSPERCLEMQPCGSQYEQSESDLQSENAASFQSGGRLRHQQLLEKKSVFDIAYSEAAPSQLRSDSTTPPS
ncbi:CAD86 protein, partial [Acromyrmex heyeri]